MEEWRPVNDFFNYEVSNHGHVRSLGLIIPNAPAKTLRTPIDICGYHQVDLATGKPNGRKHVRVHTLVAEAFLGEKPSPNHEINHKDSDRTNNHVSNLEWVTRKQNVIHAMRKSRLAVRLNASQIPIIRQRLSQGESQHSLARNFGVNQKVIWAIAHKKLWGWVP